MEIDVEKSRTRARVFSGPVFRRGNRGTRPLRPALLSVSVSYNIPPTTRRSVVSCTAAWCGGGRGAFRESRARQSLKRVVECEGKKKNKKKNRVACSGTHNNIIIYTVARAGGFSFDGPSARRRPDGDGSATGSEDARGIGAKTSPTSRDVGLSPRESRVKANLSSS